MKLTDLRDNPGAARKKKRLARGPGSGKGKMGGRGIKGQKSRSGVAIKGYEGGQMPLHRRLPKRGFSKPFRKEFTVINLGQIQRFVEAGKIKADAEITEAVLLESGLVRRIKDGVRVLGKGLVDHEAEGGDVVVKPLTQGLKITVTGASQGAIDTVAAAGGTLTVTAPKAEEAPAEG